MKLTRHHRALLAWTLYACVLFNALACSIGHAQMVGLQLSGISGMSCAVGDSGAIDSSDGAGQSSLSSTFSCPLCASVTLSLALLFCLSWLLRPSRQRFLPRPAERQPPPRFTWPSANPRASP
ncbi:MAG: DUF2946 domain-containing protein [Pseudomonas sp.]|uniref:DUF2946 domain-containing protein n=1 Tax=Pseudomonas sp. TaxID=306 RepID=UPI0027328247|nr:DUF2946 domain-containing protein [Pseudomonas sp.]MDP3846943.1 DUF2946 domain-containing protein [Pseudomonas sp.]